ncbi:MAG: hypothetical protein U0X86_001126 [Wolbachia endosymbiont of Xenopsylla cheopis]
MYDSKPVDYCFPGITLINSTETIKVAKEHYEFEHQAYEHKDKSSPIIWDVSVEACNKGIIKKPKVDGILI